MVNAERPATQPRRHTWHNTSPVAGGAALAVSPRSRSPLPRGPALYAPALLSASPTPGREPRGMSPPVRRVLARSTSPPLWRAVSPVTWPEPTHVRATSPRKFVERSIVYDDPGDILPPPKLLHRSERPAASPPAPPLLERKPKSPKIPPQPAEEEEEEEEEEVKMQPAQRQRAQRAARTAPSPATLSTHGHAAWTPEPPPYTLLAPVGTVPTGSPAPPSPPSSDFPGPQRHESTRTTRPEVVGVGLRLELAPSSFGVTTGEVEVCEIVPGFAAYADGNICVLDRVLDIDGRKVGRLSACRRECACVCACKVCRVCASHTSS